jgi:predicted RNA-binding Zn-ribbon protein involved in translation (DUF1610 family)
MISEAVVQAVFVRCPHCSAWVITRRTHCRQTGEQTFLLKCPVEVCDQEFEVNYSGTKMFQVPQSWVGRGYFYGNELDQL